MFSNDVPSWLADGKDVAFEKIYRAYWSIIFRFIYKRLQDPELSEELAQECFLRVHRNLDELDLVKYKFENWIVTIAHNLVIDVLRRERHKYRYMDWEGWCQLEDTSINLEQEVILRETNAQLRHAISRLPKGYKHIMSLWLLNYSYKEIAEKVNLPFSTVRMRILRGRKLIASNYKRLSGVA